jgi:superfamily II DNA helicase RecQ
VSKSLEGFCQEIGRGGRDGLGTMCRSFLCADDLSLLKSFARGNTPSLTSVHRLLEQIFYTPGTQDLAPLHSVVELNHYSISREIDLSPTAIVCIVSNNL